MMLHNLTIGHVDPASIVNEREIVVLRPLEMDVVHALLEELGGVDKDQMPTLETGRVEVRDGYVVCPGALAAGVTGLPRNSRSDSGRPRAASWPTGSIRGSSTRTSSKGCTARSWRLGELERDRSRWPQRVVPAATEILRRKNAARARP